MIFKTKKIDSSETLSEIFKKHRLEAKVSLEEISRLVKIPKQYLESLESGDYENLPADVYVKGYLRVYGRFFKTSPEKLIRVFQRESRIFKNLEQKREIPKKNLKLLKYPRLVITPRSFTWTLVIIALAAIFIYFWYELDLFKGLPQIGLEQPSQDLRTDQDFIMFSGKVSKQAEISLNSQSIWTDENGEFRELVPLQEGLNTIYLVATNKLGKERVITRYIIKY